MAYVKKGGALADLVPSRGATADGDTQLMAERDHGSTSDPLPRTVAEPLRAAIESISSELSLSQLLPKIVANAASLLGASVGAVSLAQGEEHTTRLAAVYNLPQSLIGRPYPSEAGLADRLQASGELILLDEEHHLDHSFSLREVYDTPNWLAVPLCWQDACYGIFSLAADPPHRFTAQDAEVLRIFARYAAIAIANARLYERAQRAAMLEERQRLARDLHDSVTQTLFGLQAAAQAALDRWETQPEEAHAAMEVVQQLARGASVEMRALLYELRDSALQHGGLASALDRHIAVIRHQTELTVDLAVADALHLPAPHEEALYRVVQEALSNVIKHARARHVAVSIGNGAGSVWVRVEDDGVGFPGGAPAFDAFGLRGMRERVVAVGGTLRLGNGSGGGAYVQAELPLPSE